MIYLKKNGIVDSFTKTFWWSDFRPITNICHLLIKFPLVIMLAVICMYGVIATLLGMVLFPLCILIPELPDFTYHELFWGPVLTLGLSGWLALLSVSLYRASIKLKDLTNNKFCPKVRFK
jgi:hypothetical protein